MSKKDKKIKEHLANFHIAGFTYYDGPKAFSSLKIGQEVQLELDPDNKYDERAVKIISGDYELGFVPRGDNRIFYKLLRTSTTNFVACIQKLDSTDHPENQIRVVAHLVEQ